jgi:hypothetical protein
MIISSNRMNGQISFGINRISRNSHDPMVFKIGGVEEGLVQDFENYLDLSPKI